jgi:hypothetical protein
MGGGWREKGESNGMRESPRSVFLLIRKGSGSGRGKDDQGTSDIVPGVSEGSQKVREDDPMGSFRSRS